MLADVPTLQGAAPHDQTGLIGSTVLVPPAADDDLAGVWRMAGLGVGVLLGCAAFQQAWGDRTLTRRQRLVAEVIAGAYVAAGAYTMLSPSWLADMVTHKRKMTLAATFAPLAATVFSGGRRSPLHTLAATAGGSSAVIYGHHTGRNVAIGASVLWSLQARLVRVPRDAPTPPAEWVYVVVPLDYLANARMSATLATLAYNARSIGSLLGKLTAEHDTLRIFAAGLDAQLADAAKLLTGLLANGEGGCGDASCRDFTLCALGRINEERAALEATLHIKTPPPVSRHLRWARRARGMIDSSAPSLPLTTRSLADICAAQRTRWAPVIEQRVRGAQQAERRVLVDVKIDPGMEVSSADRIAVIAAAVSIGMANALRHAPQLTTIKITGQGDIDDTIVLVVANDGFDPERAWRPGRGLKTLRREVERLGGTLRPDVVGGWFELTVQLGARPPVGEGEQLLSWAQVEAKLDEVFATGVTVCAPMVWANLLARPARSHARAAVSAALTALVPALTIRRPILPKGHRWPPVTASRAITLEPPQHWPLLASAAVSAISTDPHRGALCRWTNAALGRHALHHRREHTAALVGLNLAGVAFSYRNRNADRVPMAVQMATLAMLPGALLLFFVPSAGRLRRRDREIVGALSSAETVNRIALEMLSEHSCLKAIDDLCGRPELDERDTTALRASRQRIAKAAGGLGDPLDRLVNTLIDDVCTVIGQRVWPAPITVQADLSKFKARAGDTSGLHRMPIRRTAIAVADLVAREAISHPVKLTGKRCLEAINVAFGGGGGAMSKIEVTVWPVLRKDDDAESRLRERARKTGASITTWTHDGRVTFVLYPKV